MALYLVVGSKQQDARGAHSNASASDGGGGNPRSRCPWGMFLLLPPPQGGATSTSAPPGTLPAA
eukprot:367995-Rhodomonas_salina.1